MDNKGDANRLSSSHSISLILTICMLSFVFIYLIWEKNLIFGSEMGGWYFSYYDSEISFPFWIPIFNFSLIGLAVIFCGSRLIHRHEKTALLICFLVAVVVQILFQKIYPYQMDELIAGDVTNSFYSLALRYTPTTILSQFQDLSSGWPLHARANMPGKILFFQFLSVFTVSPQVMGYILISISTLGGLFLYGISKCLFQDKTIALYSFLLYVLIPCKQLFFPILNTVTPIFILVSLYLFLLSLDTKNILFSLLFGISLYVLILFEPSPLASGLIFLGILLHAIGQKKVLLKELVPLLMIPALSFAATYLLFVVFFSFDLLQVFIYILQDALQFNASSQRGYGIWIRENNKEFFYGVGLPTAMIFIYFIMNRLSQWKTFGINILHWSIEDIYTLSLGITFCAVLFLGINRGETTRLWIYLAVFFQIPVAFFMAKEIKNKTMFLLLVGTLIAQTSVSLYRVLFIAP